MTRARFVIVLSFLLLAAFVSSLAYAQDKPENAQRKNTRAREQTLEIFDMKVPPGFELQPAEEPGIYRWTKGSAEILAVVGDIFLGSPDLLFNSLRTSASKNKQFKRVQSVPMKGAKAMLLIEKTPEDPNRLETWTLVVVADTRIINVDFSAPAGEFDSFEAGFKKAARSFKLKSPS